MDDEKVKQLLKYLTTLNMAKAQSLAQGQPQKPGGPKRQVPIQELSEQEKKDRNLAAVTKCKQYKIENIHRLEADVLQLETRKLALAIAKEACRKQVNEELVRKIKKAAILD